MENKFVAPDITGTPLPKVTLNGKEEYLYDADTTIPDPSYISDYNQDQSKKYRFTGIDAAEMPSIDPLYGLTYGLFSEDQRNLITEEIEKGGFDQVIPTGEKDVYDRTLADVQSPAGFDMATSLIQRGLIDPSRYSLSDDAQQTAVTYANLERLIKGREQLPEWRKLEQDIYTSSVPSLGELTSYEELQLPKSLFSPDALKFKSDYGFIDQAGDSLELWYYQNLSSLHGIDALISGSDEERQKAYKNLENVQLEMQEEIDPRAIISIEQIEDIPTFFKWLEGAVITQGPDYAIMAGTAAAPLIMSNPIGLSLAALGTGYIYLKSTGNVAAEQYEVSGDVDQSAWAIGGVITAIDRLGAKGILKPDDFLTKDGLDKAVEVVKQKARQEGTEISTKEAKELITNQVRQGITETASNLGIKTADLISKRQAALGLARRMLRKASEEGATEFVQEGIQALAVNGAPETAEEWERFGWRLADATAAGFAVGGVYNINQSLIERNRIESLREDINEDLSQAPKHVRTVIEAKKAWQEESSGAVKNVEDIADIAEFNTEPKETLEQLGERGKGGGYFLRGAQKFIEGKLIPLSSAVKNMVRGYIYDENGRINPYTAYIATVEGAFNIISGDSLYNAEQKRLSPLIKYTWLHEPEKVFGITKNELSNLIVRWKANSYDISDFNDKERIILNKINEDSRELRGIMADQFVKARLPEVAEKYRKGIGILFESMLPDIQKISDNYQDFVSKLSEVELPVHYRGKEPGHKLGKKEAERITKELFDGDTGGTADDLQRMGVTSSPEFNQYFSENMVDRALERVFRDTKYAVRTQYRGVNNSIYANMLKKAVKEGYMTQKEADRFAADLLDQISKHANAFGRLKNKTLSLVQDVMRTATSFGLMDLVVFSQPAETVLAFIGRNQGLTKSVGALSKGFVLSFKNSIPGIAKARQEKGKYDEHDFLRNELGYNPLELIQQQGANLDNKVLRQLQQKFYKMVGLEQVTDAGRISQMVLAQDVIHQMAEQLVDADLDHMTVGQAKLYERLTHYGINVPELVSLYRLGSNIRDINSIPEALQSTYIEMMKVALPKFIDETIVRIKPGSRASIFEDQRFGLPFLSQYMSFISHFHANQLPRYYQTYLKDAAAPIAYNTFKVMMTAIMIAYVSQYLKDLLVRGELNPKLDEDTGAIQRAIQYSGLTGFGQEGFDAIVGNAYGFKSEGIFDYMLNAPSVSHLTRVAKDIGKGEYAEAAQRALPFGDLTKEDSATMKLFNYLIGEKE